MPTPLLHIVQTELSVARIGQFLETLNAEDTVVMLQQQDSLLEVLESAVHGNVFTLYETKAEPSERQDFAVEAITYARFVDIIGEYSLNRTW